MTVVIALSEGHGKHTPGKRSPNGEREWYFNNLVGQGFREEAKKYDVKVIMVSDITGERDVPLKERSDISNQENADFYVAIHHNAYQGVWGSHTGTEVYTYDGAWGGKKAGLSAELNLAKDALDAIVSTYKIYNRGIKRANFHEVREPKATAILTENGYMDSNIDIKVMRDQNKLKESGRAIFKKMASRNGFKLKAGSGAVINGDYHRVQVGAFKQLAGVASFANEVEKKAKVNTYIIEAGGFLKVQVGAFKEKANAEAQLKKLQSAGYKDAFITTQGGVAVVETEPCNEPVVTKPVAKPQPSVEQLANEVIAGKHGTGDARKKALGSRYNEVQSRVDQILKAKQPVVSTDQLAREVIAGVHGVGEARKRALGSRYAEVQAKVDQLLGVANTVIRVGDRVTTSKLYGTGQGTTPARTTPIAGYVERIDSNWKNPYRLVGTKGRQDYLGFARGVDIKK